jgi:ankyrin repeat protein
VKIIHDLLNQTDKKMYCTPLHWAASAGHVAKMNVLLEHGADPFLLNHVGDNILHMAAESGKDTMARALDICKRYPDQLNINQLNRWAETPLYLATYFSPACVKLLLEAGADPDIQTEDGQVALNGAGLAPAGANRREIAFLLCNTESKVHINTQDNEGRLPIFEFLDDATCVETLVNAGARLDLADNDGKTVFHHICAQDEDQSLRMVLPLGVKAKLVGIQDHSGNTPLFEALRHRSIKSARVLLELGLEDVGNFRDNEGWTAAHHAAKIGDADLLNAVMQHGSFVKGATTGDGKKVEVVAMEAGTWTGEIKHLLKKWNSGGS